MVTHVHNFTNPPGFQIKSGYPSLHASWGVPVSLNFSHFSPERKETGSLGTKESEV